MHLIDPVDQLGWSSAVLLHGVLAKLVVICSRAGVICRPTYDITVSLGAMLALPPNSPCPSIFPESAYPTCCTIRLALHQGLSDPVQARTSGVGMTNEEREDLTAELLATNQSLVFIVRSIATLATKGVSRGRCSFEPGMGNGTQAMARTRLVRILSERHERVREKAHPRYEDPSGRVPLHPLNCATADSRADATSIRRALMSGAG
jgi:hypothetical protein